ncbi:hypothetical protein BO78DRAFT_232308 [Aspergillus sclerotiicarbonarius CBS 121057]|uniref:Uncharacterized protein n=1 Tax=Aspergillus sclerotiicarbonarius (strain CBS 121057 / IBT 28362) TaxID=1448318 RepID=A0A319DW17_ASPSB|nr:hypothetical protein BO78DRAFT_232308 [Aspergillus sclerotiicarbonarius CBS 121057]
MAQYNTAKCDLGTLVTVCRRKPLKQDDIQSVIEISRTRADLSQYVLEDKGSMVGQEWAVYIRLEFRGTTSGFDKQETLANMTDRCCPRPRLLKNCDRSKPVVRDDLGVDRCIQVKLSASMCMPVFGYQLTSTKFGRFSRCNLCPHSPRVGSLQPHHLIVVATVSHRVTALGSLCWAFLVAD